MIKIFLTVRNRLAITMKCITALYRHTNSDFQLYVYNNLTNYKIAEQFMYWSMLYEKKYIHQIVFNTEESTYNAFSKAAACNQFGLWHEQDPNKDDYDFLLILDNDIILHKDWDIPVINAWKDVNERKMDNIKIIVQYPGGINNKTVPLQEKFGGCESYVGEKTGSGFWSIRPNFFEDVGYLDLMKLINLNKKHDQHYWQILKSKNNGEPYVMAIKSDIASSCGKIIENSVCNVLTNMEDKQLALETIKFKETDENINKLSFDEFYRRVLKDKKNFLW